MREYYVTTNTDLGITVPTLTVTVRAALFVPAGCLPLEDAGEPRGRETWFGGRQHEVLPTFEMSVDPLDHGPVVLAPVVGLDGQPIKARRRVRTSGVAYTGVRYSKVIDEDGDCENRTLGEARLPLFGKKRGDYLLKIVPAPEETTRPDAPAGPDTVVRGVKRAFRPLYVRVSLDDELHVVAAVTGTLRDGAAHPGDVFAIPDGAGGMKGLVLPVNHGYVTAFSADELAIDLKPDVLKSDILDQSPKQANHVRHAPIDMVVIHATGGLLMGSPVNTAVPMQPRMTEKRVDGEIVYKTTKEHGVEVPVRGPGGKPVPVKVAERDEHGEKIPDDDTTFGPHYEIDRDGHVVKFVPDDFVVYQAGPSHFYRVEDGAYTSDVNARSIGIEVTHQPDTAYPERQTVGLLGLLSRLKARYGVKPHRFVGHVDTLVDPDTKVMDDNRLGCPSRDLDWPRLERAGFGRTSAAKELDSRDYCGFFSLTVEELRAALKQAVPLPPALRLNDSDLASRWGGVDWTKVAKSDVPRAGNFTGIVAKLQGDLKTIGYSVQESGVFDRMTDRAVAHFIAHTFSGPRRYGDLEVIREFAEPLLQLDLEMRAFSVTPPVDPAWLRHEDIPTRLGEPVTVTRQIASYIRGTAAAVPRPG
jgi:N-acetyl-anhydromuramyl-L-alanine amidase AmpD